MYREIGIYGGTFSPPHAGHIRAATEFFNQLSLERLYIIPTAIPPHKRINPSDNPSERLTMLHLAFEDSPDYNKRIFISDYELKQSGISYTAKTLEHFSKLFSAEDGYRITILCGTDMFLTLAEWYKPKRIFELSRIAYIRRETQDKDTDQKIGERAAYFKRVYNADIVALTGDPIEISSTDIRMMLSSGKPVGSFINPGVYEYIIKNGLYKL
ncbi:MAG: nicotinate (nicotinamide) nucleotide adenylyltransferase [Eubacteriales bacterium]|jgi:nicotinate-nucleotide adenylyltransferase|nr:nicotinate (nicotinamide) nucleotide adenylyltransferase [Eubacteriales bacterium]